MGELIAEIQKGEKIMIHTYYLKIRVNVSALPTLKGSLLTNNLVGPRGERIWSISKRCL